MAKPTYIVETKFLSGWENCWEEDGKAMTFDSKDAAELEIDELLKDVLDAVESGRMPFEYERSDYRIMRYDEAIDLVRKSTPPLAQQKLLFLMNHTRKWGIYNEHKRARSSTGSNTAEDFRTAIHGRQKHPVDRPNTV